jgi:hypothetical protein
MFQNYFVVDANILYSKLLAPEYDGVVVKALRY